MQPVLLLAYTFVGATGGFRGQLVSVLTDGLVEHGPLAALTSVRRLTSVRAALLPRFTSGEVAGSSKSRLLHRIFHDIPLESKVRRDLFSTCFFFFSRRTRGRYSPNVNVLRAQRRAEITICAPHDTGSERISLARPCSVNAFRKQLFLRPQMLSSKRWVAPRGVCSRSEGSACV